MALTMEGEPGPVRTSESYPNESGKRHLSLRRRVTQEVERIVVHDGLPGDERHRFAAYQVLCALTKRGVGLRGSVRVPLDCRVARRKMGVES